MSRVLLAASLLLAAVCAVGLAVWVRTARPGGKAPPRPPRGLDPSPCGVEPDQGRRQVEAPRPNSHADVRRPKLGTEPPVFPAGQEAAELSLLDNDIHPAWHREMRQHYDEEYRRIIKPGYRFRTTSDEKEQLRILLGALAMCLKDKKLAGDFLRLALHENKYVRLHALDAFGRLARCPRHARLELLRLFVDHLDNDMSVEAFAQNLSTISSFATLPVPREKLPAWRARAVGESKAARYIAATADAIAANDGVVPRGLGGYSGIEFEGRALSIEELQ